jgi:hypothetical protein
MNSTPNPKATEPDDVLVAPRGDERLAQAYEQILRADKQLAPVADKQLAPVDEQLSNREHDAALHPSAVPGRPPSRGRPALRGLIGVLLAACILVATFVFARWAPELLVTSSPLPEKPGLAAPPSPSAVQVAAPSVQTAPQDIAATAAPMSPELAQLLQTMARDLANMKQEIEQLKTSQEQMATMRRPPSSSRRARNK